MNDFDITSLEEALSPKKGRDKTEKGVTKKAHSSDKPLLVPVDKKGKEIDPKDIKVGKVCDLKYNE